MGELSCDKTGDIGVAPTDLKTARSAVRVVAANARDADEAREFIAALGLDDAVTDLARLRALGRGDGGTA